MGRIVWLASYPKSGNTWLRFFLYAYFKLDPAKTDKIDVSDRGLMLFSTQDVRHDWYEKLIDKPCRKILPPDVGAVRRASHEMIANATQGVAFVKTHCAFIKDFGSETISPHVTAGAIYIIRNPLDVVLSLKDHFGHKSIGKAIQHMNDDGYRMPSDNGRVTSPVLSWRRNVDSWLGLRREGIHAVRYEDMLADPEKVFGWIIQLLGHEVDEDKLRWAIAATSFDKMKSAEEETGFQEKSRHGEAFFRKGVAGGWRDQLSVGQVRQIVAANHELMAKFGYMDEKLERLAPKPKSKTAKKSRR